MQLCDRCATPPTPLDEEGRCVTCDAAGEGLALLSRSAFASIRDMMTLLEDKGLAPEMEKVPPARPEERVHPLWNLYVPADEVGAARDLLRKDWAGLLEDPDATAAAERGQAEIDLDAGGEVTCPACGHRFAIGGTGEVECPECGLGLGVPGAAPDDSKE
ncbi:hypothetical protein [Anaeromyxobacter oryzae]|uniref:TFIIB-type zinc ribbon-containing protein n=1 Tax=Anaeromyxobacter oryzae TaxID=2918170 RepID=A0ABN6N2Q7_9BACT|nr:hypothetical protein [Anaeromyxobacter oryzae]BDG06148.1 hypothetical protein AMOR_51440 [Anaeromyxobacter oryzae]